MSKVTPIEAVGPQVEHHPAFPRRTNTEFIQVVSEREIIFRVWERGAGRDFGLRHGSLRGGGRVRSERQDRAQRAGASAGRRLGD